MAHLARRYPTAACAKPGPQLVAWVRLKQMVRDSPPAGVKFNALDSAIAIRHRTIHKGVDKVALDNSKLEKQG